MRKTPHLLATATATLAFAASGLIASAAVAAAPNQPQTKAAAWLADQVPGDTHLFESNSGGYLFVDYGLNLDLQHSLRELGQTSVADDVYSAVVAHSRGYTEFTYEGVTTQYAGSIGKLAAYAELKGADATSIDGRNLISELTALMSGDGQFMNEPTDGYENNIGQAWGVRALALSGSPSLGDAADFLADQQCSDGGFRETPGTGTCESSVDATAFAAVALDDAGGHDADVTGAIAWLKSHQAADGSLSDAGNPNSNSTGLAAQIFAAHGETAAAEKAAGWIEGLQLTGGPDVGAIASTEADHSDQGSNAIDPLDQDKWVRATFQAALGLGSLAEVVPPGPVASLKLKVSDATPTQGDTVTVTATGADADGRSTGDVSGELELSSSVDTDTIDGNKVTFNHASPHTITATHVPTGTTATVTVQVSPASAVNPGAGTGTTTGTGLASADTLPAAGSSVEPWHAGLAALLVMFGVALVAAGRERRFAAAHRAGADH